MCRNFLAEFACDLLIKLGLCAYSKALRSLAMRGHGIWRHHSSALIATSSDVRRRSLISPPPRANVDKRTYALLRRLLCMLALSVCMSVCWNANVGRRLQTCRKLSISLHRRRTLIAPCRHHAYFIVPNWPESPPHFGAASQRSR